MTKKSICIGWPQWIICISTIAWLIVGCSLLPVRSSSDLPLPTRSLVSPSSARHTPTVDERIHGLSDEEVSTLSSLEKVDDYPLYIMRYFGGYDERLSLDSPNRPMRIDLSNPDVIPWACSLFAALGDTENMLFGRNFDWEYSPAVLLFTNPPDGYASVSMVDIAYLGFMDTDAGTITDLPIIERRALLDAPFLPFDGMNEHGVAVGMAAVSPGHMRPDPDKETIGSLHVIRKMLDYARDVDEAVTILGSYNIEMGGGPPLHYLIADRMGRSVLVEFYKGEMVVFSNDRPWHQATNFLLASADETTEGICWRYDTIHQRIQKHSGQLTLMKSIDLLKDVSQDATQWSIVYGISTGDINVIMGQQYEIVHTFQLGSSGN